MKKATILFLFLCGFTVADAQCIEKTKGYFKYCIRIQDTLMGKIKLSKIPEFNGDIAQWFADHIDYPQ